MTPELSRLIRAARKEAHRLARGKHARELDQVVVKLQEAEMWERAWREVEQLAPAPAVEAPAPRRRWSSRWVQPELG